MIAPENQRIVVLSASAQYCINLMVLLTYGNIGVATLNFTYFIYFIGKLFILNPPPATVGSAVLRADQILNYGLYSALAFYNTIALFCNFAAFIYMESKLLGYYMVANVIYIVLGVIYIVYLTSLGVPCLNAHLGTFRHCLLLPTFSFFLCAWNTSITCLMIYVYRRLLKVNVMIREEGCKLLSLHYAIRKNPKDKAPLIDIQLKNELTVSRFISKLRVPKVAKETWTTVTTIATIDSENLSVATNHTRKSD